MQSFRCVAIATTVLFLCLGVPGVPTNAQPTPSPILAPGSIPVPGPARLDWLRIVPGEAGFYVEIHNLEKVRGHFQNLGIWKTVRELAEQEKAGTTRHWHKRTENLLGLSAEAAISQLIGRRAALFAPHSADWQSGVMLAELEHRSDVRRLLGHWKARELPARGLAHCYQLRGGLRMAVLDRLLVLGPVEGGEDYWDETIALLQGRSGSMLWGSSELQGLRARMSADYPLSLYVKWAPGDPTAVGGCRRLLVGASVTASEIACELRGQRTVPSGNEPQLHGSAIGTLPASSLAVWASSYDFERLRDQFKNEPLSGRDSLVSLSRAVMSMSLGERSVADLLGDLGPRYMVVLGKGQKSPESPVRGFELPALTVLCDVKGTGEAHIQHLDHAIGFLSQLMVTVAARDSSNRLPISIQKKQCHGTELHYVELGPLLAKRLDFDVLEAMAICWARFDGKLLLSTSVSHAEEIIRAAQERVPRLEDEPGMHSLLPREEDASKTVEWLCIRGSRVSSMLASWVSHLEKTKPEAIRSQWWRDWATRQVEHKLRLGVGLEVDPIKPGQAIVREVSPGSPAKGLLRIGDVIVGVDGVSLATSQPAREVADRYRDRGKATIFVLEVLRSGKREKVTIAVAPAVGAALDAFDPIRAIRQIISLAAPADAVTVWRYASESDRYDSRILIRWKSAK